MIVTHVAATIAGYDKTITTGARNSVVESKRLSIGLRAA